MLPLYLRLAWFAALGRDLSRFCARVVASPFLFVGGRFDRAGTWFERKAAERC